MIIGIVDILFYLVDLVVVSGISFSAMVRLFLYRLPAVMVLFFPMAVLFSVMLMLVRMAKDNELTVLRSSGVHTLRILFPIILLTSVASGGSYVINEKVVPWTSALFENLIRKETQRKTPPEIMNNVIFKDFENRFFYIKNVNKSTSEMEDVLVMDPTATYPRIITAKQAFWDQFSWTMLNGVIQDINENGIVEFTSQFDEMIIHVEEDFISNFAKRKSAKEMDSNELKEKIHTLNKGGVSTRSLRVEYHLKQSVPIACLVFGLIGMAFCVNFVKSGKDWWGVIVAIIVAVLTVGFYFVMLAFSQALAKAGNITPILGAWLPNIIYGSIAVLAIAWHSLRR